MTSPEPRWDIAAGLDAFMASGLAPESRTEATILIIRDWLVGHGYIHPTPEPEETHQVARFRGPFRRSRSSGFAPLMVAIGLGAGAVGLISGSNGGGGQAYGVAEPTQAKASCDIKGNVSTKGERIYHVPGQRYYAKTRIDSRHGERWFCSEEEARAAGWRRSKV